MDYCFPGDEFERLIVLVVIERCTKKKKAVVVPSNGSTGCCAARMVIEFINECGDKDQDMCESDLGSNHQGVCTAGQQGVERHCTANGAVSGTVPQDLEVNAGYRMEVKIDVLHPVLT